MLDDAWWHTCWFYDRYDSFDFFQTSCLSVVSKCSHACLRAAVKKDAAVSHSINTRKLPWKSWETSAVAVRVWRHRWRPSAMVESVELWKPLRRRCIAFVKRANDSMIRDTWGQVWEFFLQRFVAIGKQRCSLAFRWLGVVPVILITLAMLILPTVLLSTFCGYESWSTVDACSNFCWGHAPYHHAVRASPEGQVCLQLRESRQACTSMRVRQWNGTSKLAGCGKKIRLSYREEVKFQSAHTKSFDSCSICSVTWSGCDVLFFKNSSCSCADEILSSMATRTVLSCVKNFYCSFFEALVLWCLTHVRSLPPSLSLCAMSKCVCEPHV